MKVKINESITKDNADQYGPVIFGTTFYSDELAGIVLGTNCYIKQKERESVIDNDGPYEDPVSIDRCTGPDGQDHGECTITARTIDDFMMLFNNILEYIRDGKVII